MATIKLNVNGKQQAGDVDWCAGEHLAANYFGDLIKKKTGKTAHEFTQLKLIDSLMIENFGHSKSTGKQLWETALPAANDANVCSYFLVGKQYISLSVGGTKENPSGSIMVFKLP